MRRVCPLVHAAPADEDLQQVALPAGRALGLGEPVLRGQVHHGARELLHVAPADRGAAALQQLLEHLYGHGGGCISGEEDVRRRRLRVWRHERSGAADAHGLEVAVVVLVGPLRKGLEDGGCVRQLVEGLLEEPGQRSVLGGEAEQDLGHGSLHLVHQGWRVVAVVERCPIAGQGPLPRQQLLENADRVRVPAQRAEVRAGDAAAGLGAPPALLQHLRGGGWGRRRRRGRALRPSAVCANRGRRWSGGSCRCRSGCRSGDTCCSRWRRSGG
mmetsp:Transcript_41138/g.122945  ORF Transcript_41138/g.122945 Transcript_41138/m.122945 type:complete len:271 (+) Transcript_41138:466-1278(+)